MAEIASRQQFEEWLQDQPPEMAVIMASRIALRVLPIAIDIAGREEHRRLISTVFRAITISRSASKYLDRKIATYAGRAAAAAVGRAADARYAADAAYSSAYSSSYAADARASADATYAVTASRAAGARSAAARAADAAARASAHAEEAVHAAAFAHARVVVWGTIEDDCRWVDETGGDAVGLASSALWLKARPAEFNAIYRAVAELGYDEPDSWKNWIIWYDWRVEGQPSEWALPPKQDAEMARRLIEADEEFWKRGEQDPAFVNAQLGKWRAELLKQAEQERAIPPGAIDEQILEQNPRVPQFGESADGRIDIVPVLRGDTGQGLARRHALMRDCLIAALEASAPDKTQAVQIADVLMRLLQALSDRPETMQAEAYVLFSKAMRREFKDHLSPASSKPPLAEAQIEALDRTMDADAMLVALDDRMSQCEQAIYERRFEPVAIEREELRQLIDGVKQSGVSTEAAEVVLETALANTPVDAKPSDPDLRTIRQIAGNFLRSFGRKISNIASASGKVVKAVWKPALDFAGWISAHATELKAQFPNLGSVIDFVVKWLNQKP